MSRLYETLERISKAEQRKKAQGVLEMPVRESAPRGESRRWWIGWTLVAVSILAISMLVLIPLKWPHSPSFTTRIRTLFHSSTQENISGQRKPPGVKPQEGAGPLPQKPNRMRDTKRDPVELNNNAVKLLKKGAYWDALYLLDEAITIEPNLEAPYYNTVYALIQLGYYGAAQEYCKRIWRLFGETEWVKRNRDALKGLGIDLDRVAMEADGA